jgi:P-type Mg2+ transporter
VTTSAAAVAPPAVLGISDAAAMTATDVARALATDPVGGLSPAEAARRRATYGPNSVMSHRARFLPVLWHQLRSPLLALLLLAAAASYAVDERSSALIIMSILTLSVGLGLANEYRAEKAAEALHDQIRHEVEVVRGGVPASVDVVELVPGDLVRLRLGGIVPADLRLLEADELECEESALTGESMPVPKGPAAVPDDTPLAELTGCALMGTVVHRGAGLGVVVASGRRTRFGQIAAGLGTHQLETEFQSGLRRFSMLLVYVAGALTTSIFVVNVALHRPVLDALLFSLAIAVGITPQLLPAVVSSSLAAGSRRMRARKVLVKRLVCIEDLGDVDVLFTDKTGTLTLGRIDFMRATPVPGAEPGDVLRWGLLCTEDGSADGGNPLDQALWRSAGAIPERGSLRDFARRAQLPFDHDRKLTSSLIESVDGALTLVVKGAPETVLERCREVPERPGRRCRPSSQRATAWSRWPPGRRPG